MAKGAINFKVTNDFHTKIHSFRLDFMNPGALTNP